MTFLLLKCFLSGFIWKIKGYGLRKKDLIYVKKLIIWWFYVNESAAKAMWTGMRKELCSPGAFVSCIAFHLFVNRALKSICLEHVFKVFTGDGGLWRLSAFTDSNERKALSLMENFK